VSGLERQIGLKECDEEKSMQPVRKKSVELATMDPIASECLQESEEREKAAKAVAPRLDIADKEVRADDVEHANTPVQSQMHGLEPSSQEPKTPRQKVDTAYWMRHGATGRECTSSRSSTRCAERCSDCRTQRHVFQPQLGALKASQSSFS